MTTIDLGLPQLGGLDRVPTDRRAAEGQGLHLRPGGPLVPGLRRLRRARRGAGSCRAGAQAREHRVRLRHRLLVPLPVLPRHLRHALDPRSRAGDRDRSGRHPAGPVGVGRDRRRRRAVDRRQPPDPRAAPQRQHDDPAVQQPDLRADQGAVLAHVGGRQGHQVDADGLGGPPFNPVSLALGAEATFVGRAHGLRPQGPHRGAARPPRGTAARRWSRSTRTARSSTTARSTSWQGRDERRDAAHPVRHGEPIRFGDDGELGVVRRGSGSGWRRSPRSARRTWSSTTRPTTNSRSRCRGSPTRACDTGIGVFRQVERPTYDDLARDR